jgi:predicted Fe-S protein YdhL (DUF1289 family)
MRKREERFNWLSYTSAQQLHIIKLCKQRYYRKMKKERLQQSIEEQADINGQQELF